MWRPMMFLICLIAALSATPLRQAEAASDYARSISDRGDIEVPDGGVGDDSGATITTENSDVSGVIVLFAEVLSTDFIFTPSPSYHVFFLLEQSPPRSAARLSVRLAMLQNFLC